jgi:outer membrane receptor for Fe3+-dicitrate
VPAPAGTAGRLPFFWQWNAGVGYDWLIGVKNHLSLDLQVQNVTNRKGVIDRNQQYDTGQQLSNGYYVLNPSYGAPSFQAPRTSMVIFRYSYQ